MTRRLSTFRPVFVVGVGLHRYQPATSTPYPVLGLAAVRQALEDARLAWPEVESVFHGTTGLGLSPSRAMLRHLGETGISMQQVENASASGATAFRLAALEVATGVSEVSLALGVDKPTPRPVAEHATGIRPVERVTENPFTQSALLAQDYMQRHGATVEDLARVAVKNHANGAANPYAHRQQRRSLEEVLAAAPVAGPLTSLQCCPVGEGAAAVLVASERAIARLGLPLRRCIRIASSTQRTEISTAEPSAYHAELTRQTSVEALEAAEVSARQVDVIELHDACSAEELFYLEAIGVAPLGEAGRMLEAGAFHVGGEVAVNASGGLLAMGHPIGPTGLGQIVELTRQLRGEAGPRQHPSARVGVAHMVGIGAICVMHVLRNDV